MPVDHSKNIIEVHNLSFSFNSHPVIQSIDLAIHQGDYLGIIGPNGGGKTTLLKCMLGLLTPKEGDIKLFGQDLRVFKDWWKIGYVPQRVINFESQFPATVYEVVSMGRFGKKGLFKRLDDKDKQKVIDALEKVSMREYRNRLIGDLSGGQQQRVFIARALAGEPQVIILDEPTVGVDTESQQQFYRLLKKLNEDVDLTLVLVTHDISVIMSQSTEIACIDKKLIYHGDPKGFKSNRTLFEHYGKHNVEAHEIFRD